MRVRRCVTLDGRLHKRGSRARLWGYGYMDLSRLFGQPEGTVRQAVKRKKFNPADVVDVVRYWGELVVRTERGR